MQTRAIDGFISFLSPDPVSLTPFPSVFTAGGELVYRGRINDRAVKLGVTRPVARKHELRLALEAVLAGLKPEKKFTEAVGCYLPAASAK